MLIYSLAIFCAHDLSDSLIQCVRSSKLLCLTCWIYITWVAFACTFRSVRANAWLLLLVPRPVLVKHVSESPLAEPALYKLVDR